MLIFTAEGFSFMEKGSMAILAKAFGKKVILAPRSGYIIQDIEYEGLLKRFISYVFRKVDYVICQGKYWQELFHSLVHDEPRSKFEVIPNWIDSERYFKNRPRYELGEPPLKILYIGWIIRLKGVFDLIEATRILKNRNCQFKVIMAGDGNAMNQLKKIIHQYQLEEDVDLLGWRSGEDKMKLLRNSDIFVLPSHGEGLPNALMEAMASGLPCVASNVGAMGELLIQGETGMLIDPGNPSELADRLEELLGQEDLRRKFSQKGREHVSKYNSIQYAMGKLETLIRL